MKLLRLMGFVVLLELTTTGQLLAQTSAEPSKLISIRTHILSELATWLSEGLISEEEYEHSLEVLERLLLQPLDINTATEDELQDIPLLSDYQIYQLLKARADTGGFDSVYDLKLLPGWTEETTRWVLPLLRCSAARPRQQSLWQGGRMSYALTATHLSGREEEHLGNGWGSSLRWGYHTQGGLSAFLGAELDRGEPWVWQTHRGFDSYAGHLAYRGRGALRQLILGDYRVSWGEGLLLGQGQTFARLGRALGRSRASTLRPISGVSEANKLRGLAVEYAWGRWQIVGLGSQRSLDGRLGEDATVYGLREDGLHRTNEQWARRGTVPMTSWGARLAYEGRQLTLGVQHLRYHWGGLRLSTPPGSRGVPSLALLERYSGTSLSYAWLSLSGATRLSGEVARDARGNWATVHELWYRGGWGEMALSMRKLSESYWSYFGSSALSIGLRPRDEEGLRLSLSTRELAPALELSGMLDLYRRPSWQAGGIGRYSLAALVYQPSQAIELRGQWTEHHRPSMPHRRRIRLGAKLLGTDWALELGGTCLWLSQDDRHPRERAYELDGRLRYQLTKALQLWANMIYFDAPSPRTRLYAYEPHTRYDYGSAFLWGTGTRSSVGAKWQATERLHLETKIAYLNRGRLYPNERQLWLTLVWH